MSKIHFNKLALSPTSLIDRECHKTPAQPKFFIYGAGTLGRKLFKELLAKGHSVRGFLDNNPLLQGERVDGLICIPFTDIKPTNDDVCVISIWHYRHDPAHSLKHARDLGFSHVLHFSAVAVWLNLVNIFPNYAVDHPAKFFNSDTSRRTQQLLNSLSDRASRDTALKIIHFHAYANMEELPPVASRELPFDPTNIKTYIDGGAFVGEDFKQHMSQFTSLLAARLIEPDPQSFCTLQRLDFPSLSDFLSVNAALSSEPGTITFRANGNWGSKVVDGPEFEEDITVDCITLDMVTKAVPVPIYIKMDLEGHELSALSGAHELLCSDDAIFSITLEHKALDIFEIPELLSKYNHRRSFLFAHDSEFCMDLVLYSVPYTLQLKL